MEDKYQKMYQLYCEGMTLREIAKQFGISAQAVHKAFRRRGWDTRIRPITRDKESKVQEWDDTTLLKFKTEWDQLDSKVKGVVVENYVANKLAELGFDVWKPMMNNHTADLGVWLSGRLIRIQVKAATYDPVTKRFRCSLQTRDKHGKHICYQPTSVDFFIVFCPGVMAFYVIPATIGCKEHSLNLYPHRGRFKEATSYIWERYKDAFDLLRQGCE